MAQGIGKSLTRPAPASIGAVWPPLLHARTAGAPDQAASESDLRDIDAARGGDEEAYARLVARYQGEIGAYMWRFTRDRGLWEELVHDVFVEAYFSLNGFRGEAPFLHWLRKIATRTGYGHWRRAARERHRRELARQEYAAAPRQDDDAAEVRQRADLLHAILAELPPRDRMVVTLLHLEELSTKEIAELTGWSHAMVRVQAFRARNKLKALLEKHLGSERP